MGDYRSKLADRTRQDKPGKDNPGTFFLDTASGQVEVSRRRSSDMSWTCLICTKVAVISRKTKTYGGGRGLDCSQTAEAAVLLHHSSVDGGSRFGANSLLLYRGLY